MKLGATEAGGVNRCETLRHPLGRGRMVCVEVRSEVLDKADNCKLRLKAVGVRVCPFYSRAAAN